MAVGNVPYTMTEEQLVEIFKSVGQVVGFRLVFDRDTAKPKGYGFCEFADHEIALSAIRNLDNTEVGGRSLRIDLAECDPFLEGKTTVRGEVLAGGRHFEPHPQRHLCGPSQNNDQERLLVNVPPGISVPGGSTALDSISQTLGTMRPSRLMEVLALTKAFVITHPDQARILLSRHPQLSYALFQALLLNKIVDSAILERMLGSSRAATAHPTPAPVSPPVMQRAVPGSPIYHVTPAQFASHMPPFLSQGHQQTSVPPVAFAIPPPAALSTHHPGSALSVHGTTTPFYLCSQASSPEHLLTVSPPQPVSTPATGQCPNPEATP